MNHCPNIFESFTVERRESTLLNLSYHILKIKNKRRHCKSVVPSIM